MCAGGDAVRLLWGTDAVRPLWGADAIRPLWARRRLNLPAIRLRSEKQRPKAEEKPPLASFMDYADSMDLRQESGFLHALERHQHACFGGGPGQAALEVDAVGRTQGTVG